MINDKYTSIENLFRLLTGLDIKNYVYFDRNDLGYGLVHKQKLIDYMGRI